MKKVLAGEWKCPWTISEIVADIKANIQGMNFFIQHTFREGNKLADYLSNQAINNGKCKYEFIKNLEPAGRRITNSDKLQFPYLRVYPLRR